MVPIGLKVIEFDHVDQYDDYSLTPEKIKQEMYYFGIAGFVDLGFSNHILVIAERELAFVVGNLSVWRVKKVTSIPICKKAIGLTLDELEFETVTLRDLEQQLSNGHCYFSYDIDLTNGLQFISKQGTRSRLESALDFSKIDYRFFWNRMLLSKFFDEKYSQFLVPMICGFVGCSGIQNDIQLILLSRISTYQAGTRYWTRGVDEQGNAAIEVETDIITISSLQTASFRLLRGSVPLIWSQNQLLIIKSPSINLNEIVSRHSINSMCNHFERLIKIYGPDIHIIDLIDRVSRLELYELSHSFELAVKNFKNESLIYTKYNPRKVSSNQHLIRSQIRKIISQQGFFLCDHETDYSYFSVKKSQSGIFRVNDLDCVDDTSVFQLWIAEEAIQVMFDELTTCKSKLTSSSLNHIRYSWLQMSNAISNHYCGSLVLNPSRIFNSWIYRLDFEFVDFYVQITRFYLSHFQDYARQDRIDLLMKRFQKGYEDVHSQYRLRKRILFADYDQRWYVAIVLISRRFTAPRKVDSIIDFFMAIHWTLVYMFLILIGWHSELFLRRPKYLIEVDSLPKLENVRRGLAIYLEEMEKKQPQLRISTRVLRSEDHPIHSAVPYE
jgi:phosphatidylinositol 4-phosphatase